jgi:hypothetical protein
MGLQLFSQAHLCSMALEGFLATVKIPQPGTFRTIGNG